MGFDSLGYSQRLIDAGVDRRQAEAQAALARDHILAEVATRDDLDEFREDVERQIGSLRTDLEREVGGLRADLEREVGGLRADLEREVGGLRADLEREVGGLRADLEHQGSDLRADMERLRGDLTREIQLSAAKQTTKLGAMLAVSVGALVALERFLG